jgi:hypothetical protein
VAAFLQSAAVIMPSPLKTQQPQWQLPLLWRILSPLNQCAPHRHCERSTFMPRWHACSPWRREA